MPAVHETLLAATIPDALTFAIAAIICVGGSAGVVLLRNPVHAALSLVATLFGVAVLFVEQDAQFLAAVQVIVYAGAIVVLFLFVIMLLGVDRREKIFDDGMKAQRLVGVALGVLVFVEVILLARTKWPTGAHSLSGKLEGSGSNNVQVLGQSIFTTYLLPFEITSALLVIAIVGAVVLSRRPQHLVALDSEPGIEAGVAGAGLSTPDGSAGKTAGAAADGAATGVAEAVLAEDTSGSVGPDAGEDEDGGVDGSQA